MNPEMQDFSRATPILELQQTYQMYITTKHGSKAWRDKDGERHRLDGPAIEYSSGFKEWWINGKYLTEKEFHAHPDCTAWPRMTVDSFGNKEWKNREGERHRLDGPAEEWVNGKKLWCQNDKLHRLDGPAFINTNKAMNYVSGNEQYWIDGNILTEEEFYAHPECTITKEQQ